MITDPDVGGTEVGDNIAVAFKLVDTERGAGVEEAFFTETGFVTWSEITKKGGSVHWDIGGGGNGRKISLAIYREKLKERVCKEEGSKKGGKAVTEAKVASGFTKFNSDVTFEFLDRFAFS